MYYTVLQAAKELEMPSSDVFGLCKFGWFGRKIGNTWLITGDEIEAAMRRDRISQSDLPMLYSSQQAIKILGISRMRFYRMIIAGEIEATSFGRRGGQPNYIMTVDQLEQAKQAVAEITT